METVAAGMVVLVAIKLDVSEAAIVNIIVNGLDVTKYLSENDRLRTRRII